MRADDYFWQLLMDNMFQGLGSVVRLSGRRHILLAQVMLKHDYRLAALIAARVFEVILGELATRFDVERVSPKKGQSPSGALKDRIKRDRMLERLGIPSDELDDWWEWRNDAVHPDREISQFNASAFVDAMLNLYTKTTRPNGPAC